MFKNTSIATRMIGLFIIIAILATFSFIHMLYKEYENNLLNQGRYIAEQVVLFRGWAADFGGIWTKNKYTPDIGYLMSSENKRENILKDYKNDPVSKESESTFYLHNPALATRELSRYAQKKFGYTFRVVSDRYMASESKPDDFESRAIQSIKFSKIDEFYGWDGDEFRYTKAIKIKPGCLKCHGAEDQVSEQIKKVLYAKYGDNVQHALGYKVGDFRGLISVNVYPKNIFLTMLKNINFIEILFFIIALGLFYWFSKNHIVKPVKKLTHVAHEISEGNMDIDTSIKDLDESKVKDEIKLLAIAIERLKTSVKIALDSLK